MADSVESVKTAARLYNKWASEADPEVHDSARARWASISSDLDSVADELVALRNWARPVSADYGDLSDLPPELLSQLSGTKTDALEDQVYAIVKASGTSIELDRLLIELYRRFGDVHERRFLNNKCYRMVQKALIHQVPGRKGVYSIIPQAKANLKDLNLDDLLEEDSNTAKSDNIRRESFAAEIDDDIPF